MPRERKPLDEHRLNGTKPSYVVTPDIAPGRPKYPRGISKDARRAFKKLCSLLEQRRQLTSGDGELLRLWAVIFTRHEKATEKLAEEGEIVTYHRLNNRGESVPSEKPNLWLRVAQDAEKQMVAILDRMGLTPMNKSKVKATAPPQEVKPVDPAEALLDRPRSSASTNDFPPELADIDEEALVQ